MEIPITRFSLKKLRRLFDDRVLAVPEIQREFVWDPRKVCSLLDRLYRGYPIGSALVWRTTRLNKTQLREKLHILPPYDANNPEIWFSSRCRKTAGRSPTCVFRADSIARSV